MKLGCCDQPPSPKSALDVLCGASLLSPCFRRARSQNTSLLFRRQSERAVVDARGALARMNNRQWGIRVGAEGGRGGGNK